MQFISKCFFKKIKFTFLFTLFFSVISCSFLSTCFSNPIQTIVIDPGHGGFDTGTKGADSSLEKDICLIFAKQAKSLLEKEYNIILTRTGDYWAGTRKRTEIANNSKADLFISIHTGASFIHETKGPSFIYFEPSDTSEYNKNGNITQPNWFKTQEKLIPLSRLFAKSLFERFSKNPIHGHSKINGLPVSILSGANMPAILIELEYLTNPSEEKRLNNPDFISDYTRELCAEIRTYLKKYQSEY